MMGAKSRYTKPVGNILVKPETQDGNWQIQSLKQLKMLCGANLFKMNMHSPSVTCPRSTVVSWEGRYGVQ